MALNKKDLQEAEKIVKRINDLYKQMGEDVKFPMPDASSTLQDFIAIQKLLKETEATQKSIADEAERVAKAFKEAEDAQRDLEEEAKELFGAIAATVDEMKKFGSGQAMAVKSAKNLQNVSKDFLDIQQGLVEASTEDLEKLAKKAELERENLIVAQDILSKKAVLSEQEKATLANIENGLLKQGGLHDAIVAKIKEQVKESARVDKQMGNLGAGVEAVKGGLDKIGMGALGKAMGLDDALKKTREQVKAGEAGNSQLSAQAALAKNVGKNLAKAFGPLAIAIAALGQLVKAFKAVDKSSGEIAKSQGISVAEAKEQVALANQQALASGDVLVNTQDLVDAQRTLNAAMGTSMQFPAQMALDINTMAEKMGLTGEAQAFFAKQQLKGSGTIKEQLQGIGEITMQLNEQSGVTMNLKDIQEGVAKASATQRLAAAGNTKELANQVYQSKLLGLEAADLEGVQNSLLDFEQSIAAEMEAELMTGKQLNLEGARAAALRGDQAALAAEMRKEIGTIAEFEGMNVLQREALAKAFGVNVEQMTKMLEQQKILGQLQGSDYESQSAAQKAYNALVDEGMSHEQALQKMKLSGIDDIFAAQLKSASQADRMNALTERLSDLFIGIAEPLMTLLDPLLVVLTEIVNLVSYVLAPAFKAIKDTVTGIQAIFSGNVESLNKMQMILGSIATVAGTFFATFKGIKAVQAGILALKTAYNAKQKQGIALTIKDAAIGFKDSAQKVIAGAWKSLGTIPVIGAGLAAAAAIAGILFLNQKAKTKSAGDVSIDPRGGPIVSSPQEGTIFQGTRNDGVSMGPGEGLTARSQVALANQQALATGEIAKSQGISVTEVKERAGGGSMEETNTLLRQLIAAVNSGGNVYLDGNKVGKSLAIATSNMG
jgi:hypothetical protein